MLTYECSKKEARKVLMAFLTNEKYLCDDEIDDAEGSETLIEFNESFAGFDMYIYPSFTVRANIHYRCNDSSFTLSFTPMKDNEISDCDDIEAIKDITDKFWDEIEKVKNESENEICGNPSIIGHFPKHSDHSMSNTVYVMNQKTDDYNGISEIPLPDQFPMEVEPQIPDDIAEDTIYCEMEKMMEGC